MQRHHRFLKTPVDAMKLVKLLNDADNRVNPAGQFGAAVLARCWPRGPGNDRGEGFGGLDLEAYRGYLSSPVKGGLVQRRRCSLVVHSHGACTTFSEQRLNHRWSKTSRLDAV